MATNFTTIANECEATYVATHRHGCLVRYVYLDGPALVLRQKSYIPQRVTLHSSLKDNTNQIIAIARISSSSSLLHSA